MPIATLITLMQKLQGIGPKSARRIVLHLLQQDKSCLLQLSQSLHEVAERTRKCTICSNIDISSPCQICSDEQRDKTMLCIVENMVDLWALEKTGSYHGRYYILGGALSMAENFDTHELNIQDIIQKYLKIEAPVQEIIIATSGTIDGQTTAFFITEKLKDFPIKITRLAFGLPIGAELDYLDNATIETALKLRSKFD